MIEIVSSCIVCDVCRVVEAQSYFRELIGWTIPTSYRLAETSPFAQVLTAVLPFSVTLTSSLVVYQ